ncbi:SDR family oxidoreductase [Microbacterium lushaniae]|nr:SDR family oxidoreductase [Microbacterium lushaniae]KAA9155240.1 SDR family oxidoreductase [Microbacterium lushaniae]
MASFTFDLEGAAFVTGGASGIGRAIAVGIAERGGDVALFDLSSDALEDARAEVAALGVRAIAIAGDVTDAESLEDAVRRTEREIGPLRYAVNSAGIANAAPAETMPREQWQRVYDIDVTGVFLSCQSEGRAMLRGGGGAIVNIASMSGSMAHRGLQQVHYNSAKAAVKQLSRSLAVEWAGRGIRVNSLSPGYTFTAMNRRPEVATQVVAFAAETPIGRLAEPEEMAGPAVFLLSSAASYCTGQDLLIDGGYTAW